MKAYVKSQEQASSTAGSSAEPVTNFQVQYFPTSSKDCFKEWAHQNGVSMKGLLERIILKRSEVQEILWP